MNIPYLDLQAQYKAIKPEIDQAIERVLSDQSFILGPHAQQFEKAYASMHKAKYAIAVGNGTDALFIALKALDIHPGDEVITAANSFIASSEAITLTGAKVVFADCDSETYCIDPDDIERKITTKTKAIIPVHLYGQMAPMDRISELAKRYNLKIVEDASQAMLAQWNNHYIGYYGDFATMSFYPGKNLGAYGDAGALLTNNEELYTKAKMYANHGRINKYDHEFEGTNSRMDGIQAAILNVKLKYIQQWTQQRIQVAQWYQEMLNDETSIILPYKSPSAVHVYHIYPIRVNKGDRNDLLNFLKEKGIGVGIHYPIALPSLQAYAYLNHSKSDFPNAEKFTEELISLPIYPELSYEQVCYIASQIKTFFSER
jgi:dTDP-4-amino-4,6-dideoxygalactose transaminase